MSVEFTWQIAVAYVVVMAVVSGIRGGVREEMDGIADLFAIVFWPLWLVGLLIWVCYRILFLFGEGLGGKRE